MPWLVGRRPDTARCIAEVGNKLACCHKYCPRLLLAVVVVMNLEESGVQEMTKRACLRNTPRHGLNLMFARSFRLGTSTEPNTWMGCCCCWGAGACVLDEPNCAAAALPACCARCRLAGLPADSALGCWRASSGRSSSVSSCRTYCSPSCRRCTSLPACTKK